MKDINNLWRIGTWINLSLNYKVWVILFFSFFMFALALGIYNLIELNTAIVLSWGIIIPSFLTTLYLSSKFFGEKINASQYPYIIILLICMVFSIYSIWGYVKNG